MHSVSGKLMLCFGVILAFFAVYAIVIICGLIKVEKVVEKTATFNEYLNKLSYIIGSALVVKDQRVLDSYIEELEKLKRGQKLGSENFGGVSELIEAYLSKLEDLIEILKSKGSSKEVLDSYKESASAVLKELSKIQQKNIRNLKLVGIVLGLVALGISLVLVRLLTSSIKRPLEKLKVLVENLENGVLNVEIEEIKSRDEIGRMVLAVEKVREVLLRVVTSINKASSDLTEASEELSAATEEISASLNSLAERMNKMSKEAVENSAALEEINASIKEFSQAASDNASAADKMLQETNKLFEVFEEKVESVKVAKDKVVQTKEIAEDAMERLGKLK